MAFGKLAYAALLAATLSLAAGLAQAAERVALVIGNAGYATLGSLPNVVGDSEAITEKLGELGFLSMLVLDATKAETQEAIDTFTDAAKDAEIALFFYAGHGVQVNGANLLIPVDARIDNAAALPGATVDLDAVMAAASGARVSVIMVDTSRNNPFDGEDIPDLPARAATNENVLTLFSTAPGSHAMDGPGDNSPFVAALLEHLGTPGDDLEAMARKVLASVNQATSGGQVPSYHSTLKAPVVLAK